MSQSFSVNTVLSFYKTWWNKYRKAFINTSKNGVPLGGQTFPLLQRDYAHKPINGCIEQAIPFIEITPYYRNASGGLLFVNCNPSGTDYKHYGKNNQNHEECFVYSKKDNPYFKAIEKFTQDVQKKANLQNLPYAMIDVFPIVIQNQAVFKTAFYSRSGFIKTAFDELLDVFLDNIMHIQPKVVIVTNAFVKDLLFTKKEFTNYGLQSKYDEDNVCYHITIKRNSNVFDTTVFCGGMIAGGHQMDTESKARLIRDVGIFTKNH